MDYNQVEKLLEKYWVGETSLQEEQALKQFFVYAEVPEELSAQQKYFQFLKLEKELPVPIGFEDRLMRKLAPIKKPTQGRSILLNLFRAAAIALLFWTAVSYFQNDNTMENKILAWEAKYEPEDPQEAYRQTKAALYLLSTKLRKGTTKAIESVNRVKESAKVFK